MFDYWIKANKQKNKCKGRNCPNYYLDSAFCRCCNLYSDYDNNIELFLRLFNK